MKKYKHLLLFWLIILISRAIFAFFCNTFGQDVARDLVVIDQHRKTGQHLFYYGPKASVANFYLPPAYYQVHYLLSLVTSNHPYTMKFFTIFLESLTPIILYLVLKKIGLKNYALIGAFLYAISYFPANFGIQAWNPNTIPFFSTLFLLLLLIYLEKDKPKFLLGAIICLNLAVQFHYQGVVLGLFTSIIAIYQLSKNFKKYWANWILASLLMIGLFTPYFIGEMKNHWQNTQAIITYFTGEHKNYYQRVSKPDYVLTFIPSFFEMVMIGKHQAFKFLGRLTFFIGFAIWFRTIFINRKSQQQTAKNSRWVFIYFICILLMFRVYKGDKVSYYMSTIFILPSILWGFLWQFKKKITIILTMLMVFLIGQQFAQVNFRNDLKQIKNEINLLEANLPQKEIALFFHNSEQINTYVYALDKFSNLKINQQSKILVEVCHKTNILCNNVHRQVCQNSKTQVYTLLLRDQFAMQTIKVLEFPEQQKFCINQLTQDLQPLHYQYYNYNFEYGSDVLIPEIARYNQY